LHLSEQDDILKLRLGAKKAVTKDWFGKVRMLLALRFSRAESRIGDGRLQAVCRPSPAHS
jgi:hypothetical protein